MLENKIKVLITSEQSPFNPYMYYLYLGICKETEVVSAISPFWTSNLKFDVIHIHFPEFVVDKKIYELNIREKLVSRLKYWHDNGSKIVITRHNYRPHNEAIYPSHLFNPIYDIFYKYADSIIHHGMNSYNDFMKDEILSKKINIVINHPNYLESKKINYTKEQARHLLNIKNNEALFLSLGEIRLQEEENFLIAGFKNVNLENKKLLITRSIFSQKKYGKSMPIKWLKHKLQEKKFAREKIIFNASKMFQDEDLHMYIIAADVIISPRIYNLNSGIVYLALSFGKVVIGPNIGNICNVLDVTGNPKFEVGNANTLTKAMITGYGLSKTNQGVRNLNYVKNECNIYKLGQEYLDLYYRLLRDK